MKVFNEINMTFPLVSEERKKLMCETVEKLNTCIKPCPSFDFKDDDEFNEDGLWDWGFNRCYVCDKIWYMERNTCNGTTSEAVKLHNGLKCPHCGCGYCSFEHMKPKILVDNNEEVNELTGVKSCVIYKMCVSYLKHMTMNSDDDSFITGDSGYSSTFVDESIQHEMGDVGTIRCLRYVLMKQDAKYDEENCLKEEVVKFVDEHFNDYEEYRKMIKYYNSYCHTNADAIISTFVGCRNCLKC